MVQYKKMVNWEFVNTLFALYLVSETWCGQNGCKFYKIESENKIPFH